MMRGKSSCSSLPKGVLCLVVAGFSLPSNQVVLPAAEPEVRVISNSANQRIALVRRGNEAYPWYAEQATDYTVVHVPDTYEYAYRAADGSLASLGLLAGKCDPAQQGLRPRVMPSPEFLRERNRDRPSTGKLPPSPRPSTVEQPDGTRVSLLLRGGMSYSWYEEPQTGYTVVHVRERWEYALRGQDGSLLPTGLEVGTVDPGQHGLMPGVSPSAEFLRQR